VPNTTSRFTSEVNIMSTAFTNRNEAIIVFRKSANTNSFGLRGYWVYQQVTGVVKAFASSTELSIGQRLTTPPNGFGFREATAELLEDRKNVPLDMLAAFNKEFTGVSA
jgi:hypothetical protein